MRTLLLLAFVATTAAAQSDELPLATHILRPYHGQLPFDVSDRAYVAIYWVPVGRSTPTLIYPLDDNGPLQAPGEHTVALADWVSYAMSHDGVDTGPLIATLVIVASRTPLPLDRYGRTRYGHLVGLDGVQFARNSDAGPMAERIANAIAPKGATVVTDSYLWRD